MSDAALEAAARIFANTPPERITTHRLGDECSMRRGGRPRVGVPQLRIKFIRANMDRMKRRQIAAHLGITPDRVSRYLQLIRRGG